MNAKETERERDRETERQRERVRERGPGQLVVGQYIGWHICWRDLGILDLLLGITLLKPTTGTTQGGERERETKWQRGRHTAGAW
jgi:hypothetical protein